MKEAICLQTNGCTRFWLIGCNDDLALKRARALIWVGFGRTHMKDQILSAYLRDFIEKFGLGSLKEDEAFERLASYCVVAKHYADTFDPDDVSVGGPGDL